MVVMEEGIDGSPHDPNGNSHGSLWTVSPPRKMDVGSVWKWRGGLE